MTERRCPECGQPNPIELEMKVKGGQALTMLSCGRCEARSWLSDGEPVSKSDVLKLTAGDPDFTVVPSPKTQRRTAKR
ncbi:MAG: hypothetical protein JJD92_05565 [Frankiaceae bacterium]|nr:hypothetical protein [Frankiaceae bacterium]